MAGLAIICPGQGAQHPEMFSLALQVPAAAQWLEAYSDALEVDVVGLARSGRGLFSNRNGQMLMCGATVSTWIALQDQIATPDVFAGYSVGEMSAYGCAGAWDATQLAHIILRRAELMDETAPRDAGLMAVKGLDLTQTQNLCNDFRLALAIVNAADHVILGGLRVDLSLAQDALHERSVWCQLLDVAVPAHTPFMHEAAQGFCTALGHSGIALPAVPVLAGIDGCATGDIAAIIAMLTAQIEQPVRWQDCMREVVEQGVGVVLELGPGKGLSRMFDGLGEPLESRSVDDFRTLDGVVKWVNARTAT